MPSVFVLEGQLRADTSAFERSLRSAEDRLKGTDAALNKTIASSNKLGDTSATVAQRYNKLSEGIALQNARLKEAATAYASGDINARKYASVLASVETQTRTLATRIADAKARVQELNETSLTHFQQQIQGAVDKSHSLINLNSARPLQGLGPVLQGLGARQFGLDETILNILIVAARQAGILKVAEEGTAVAAAAAATAETEFSVASRAAASSQAVVATESQATAAAMTEAAGTTTIFGAGIVSVGVALAAGVVSILAAKKASEDILKTSLDRLKTEEAIEGAINKQYEALSKFKAKLAEESDKRAFDRFTGGDNAFALQSALSNLQSAYNSDAQSVLAAQERARQQNAALGLTGANAINNVNSAVPADFAKIQADRQEKILALTARIDEINQAFKTFPDDVHKGISELQDRLKKNAQENEQAQRKAAEAAKALAQRMNAAAEATENYVKSLQTKLQGSFGTSLTDYQLKREAQEFRQGYKFGPQSASEKLQGQLSSLPGLKSSVIQEIVGAVAGGSLAPANLTRAYQQFEIQKDLDPQLRRKLDEAIVQITSGVDPASLTFGQRQLAAQARDDLIKQDREQLIQTLTDLKNAIDNGTIVTFRDQSNSVESIKANPAATGNRYPTVR